MGIMVSYTSNKISKASLEFQALEKMPCFVSQAYYKKGVMERIIDYLVTKELVDGKIKETREPVKVEVPFTYPSYAILNLGGNIKKATLKTNIYLVIIDSQNNQIAIPIKDYIDIDRYVDYNYVKKEFSYSPYEQTYIINKDFLYTIEGKCYSLESGILILGEIEYIDYLNNYRKETIFIETPFSENYTIKNQETLDDLTIDMKEYDSEVTANAILSELINSKIIWID